MIMWLHLCLLSRKGNAVFDCLSLAATLKPCLQKPRQRQWRAWEGEHPPAAQGRTAQGVSPSLQGLSWCPVPPAALPGQPANQRKMVVSCAGCSCWWEASARRGLSTAPSTMASRTGADLTTGAVLWSHQNWGGGCRGGNAARHPAELGCDL